jgi:hypothetical protein
MHEMQRLWPDMIMDTYQMAFSWSRSEATVGDFGPAVSAVSRLQHTAWDVRLQYFTDLDLV